MKKPLPYAGVGRCPRGSFAMSALRYTACPAGQHSDTDRGTRLDGGSSLAEDAGTAARASTRRQASRRVTPAVAVRARPRTGRASRRSAQLGHVLAQDLDDQRVVGLLREAGDDRDADRSRALARSAGTRRRAARTRGRPARSPRRRWCPRARSGAARTSSSARSARRSAPCRRRTCRCARWSRCGRRGTPPARRGGPRSSPAGRAPAPARAGAGRSRSRRPRSSDGRASRASWSSSSSSVGSRNRGHPRPTGPAKNFDWLTIRLRMVERLREVALPDDARRPHRDRPGRADVHEVRIARGPGRDPGRVGTIAVAAMAVASRPLRVSSCCAVTSQKAASVAAATASAKSCPRTTAILDGHERGRVAGHRDRRRAEVLAVEVRGGGHRVPARWVGDLRDLDAVRGLERAGGDVGREGRRRDRVGGGGGRRGRRGRRLGRRRRGGLLVGFSVAFSVGLGVDGSPGDGAVLRRRPRAVGRGTRWASR